MNNLTRVILPSLFLVFAGCLSSPSGSTTGDNNGDDGATNNGATNNGTNNGATNNGTHNGDDSCGECEGDMPVCLAGECVECSEDDDSACTGGVCNTETNECVECTDHTDCNSPDEARCNDNECAECTSEDHCTRFEDTPVCGDGTCVGCTTGDASACEGKVCDVAAGVCSTQDPATAELCEPCLSDAHCSDDRYCIPSRYEPEMRTIAFCMDPFDDTCVRPFRRQTVAGVDGAMRDACVLPTTATCEAYGDTVAGKMCDDDDDDCGNMELADGICTFGNRCSYTCQVEADCPASFVCIGAPDGTCVLE